MGLFDTIGKSMGIQGQISGQILGGSGESAPYDAAHLDDQTTNMIRDQANRAQGTDADYANQITHGTDQSAELARAHQGLNDRMRARGGSDFQAMGDALQNRASKSYSRDLNQIQRQSKSMAQTNHFDDLSQSQQNMMSRYQNASQLANARNIQMADAEAARNKMIGNIMGGIGAVVGSIVGGPAGGAAGGSVGQQVGGGQSTYSGLQGNTYMDQNNRPMQLGPSDTYYSQTN